MKVLVIGYSGYIGSRLMALMRTDPRWKAVGASRHAAAGFLRLDTCDEAALTRALCQVDAVVHCVAGSAKAIAEGARTLVRAARTSGVRSIVHLSSMAAYGELDQPVDETTPLGHAHGWYARAKQQAEAQLLALAREPHPAASTPRVTVLRPGCVWGPGSTLWVGRIVRWLRQGRLGDLGAAGDGWTHGVMVDDVCIAILRSLQRPAEVGLPRVLNLAAPDSPRWNTWFTDLALAVGATPLRRIRPGQLLADGWVLGPPLYLARRLLSAAGGDVKALPEPISPTLLRLWRRPLRMDASEATRVLDLAWTPYPQALRQCVAALSADPAKAAGASCPPPDAARAP